MTKNSTVSNSKVVRVIESYNLDDIGLWLENRWTGKDGERMSLRDLADEFNKAVLKSVLSNESTVTTSSDVESTYLVLSGDDISDAEKIRKQRELEQRGIDVEQVLSDFVTHQSIHTYLTKHRGVELPNRSETLVERKIETIDRLRGRTEAVSKSSLESVVNAGEITDRNYELLVDIRVICTDCGSTHSLSELLRQRGCDCSAD